MIAGRERDDPPLALLFGELEQGVHGPPDLERAGALQVFALETDLETGLFRNRMVRQKRSTMDVRPEPASRGANIIDANGQGHI